MLVVNTLDEKHRNTILVYGLSGNTPGCDFVPWLYFEKLPLLLWSNYAAWLRFTVWAEHRCECWGVSSERGPEPPTVQRSCAAPELVVPMLPQRWAWAAEMSIWEPGSRFLTAEGGEPWSHPDSFREAEGNRLLPDFPWQFHFPQNFSSTWEISVKQTCMITLREVEEESEENSGSHMKEKRYARKSFTLWFHAAVTEFSCLSTKIIS